ncbi:ATP-binding protein [Dethiobacter alkaliphilus]|uniref:Circadian input-output histidine kinase CikA n=1 Tax=Dethiobacter alkaliphilus AHT 1 TaxID=555088 RepID=C0GFL9_DETAL|nr:DUF3365 domain-containing protein [Dethiobacter alkaliphilus]EEG77979.1 integral membrane sensor signal transduction histidine kinase [Dethiobacter alkaliphilus AHT 1]
MKNKKLIHIYMFYIILAMSALMLINLGWSIRTKRAVATENMLGQARLITDQFISVRTFMAAKQDIINYDSEGSFEFKYLNPAAVGRGVGEIFNEKSEYAFKQTRLEPRNAANTPDSFEIEQIKKLQEEPGQEYLWAEDELDGTRVFRYLVPLYAEKECLDCHGTPAGEPDISGHLREGLEEGDFAGALSVVINAQPYYEELYRSIGQQVIFVLALLVVIIGILYVLQRKLVTAPLEGLAAMTVSLGQGDFSSTDSPVNGQGEIRILEERFRTMSRELAGIYQGLEQKVKERTVELEEEKEKLARINHDLEKMNRLQSEFLASVSHELRTPLSCILAFIELLEAPAFAHQRQQNLADLKSSSEKLLNMVNNLLDTAKLEAGAIEPDIQEHRADEIVQGTIKAFMPLAREKSLTVTSDIEPGLPRVKCDVERVRQVLVNLLGNAVKFTDPGGRITVRVNSEGKTQQYVVFRVEDTGAGISREEKEVIFQRFRQGAVPVNKKQAGSGLGLYLSKGLIEMQGGEIGLESEPGQGTAFWFRLPAAGGESLD